MACQLLLPILFIATSSPPPSDDLTCETLRDELVCGATWQDAYATLHAEAAASEKPRILVFDVAGNGGYADRLTGLMTALLIAILTDRALTLDWPGYDTALTTPRLKSLPKLLQAARFAPPVEVRRLVWLNANRKVLHQELTGVAAPPSPPAGVPPLSGLNELWPERVLFLRSNRGFTQQLLRAPNLAAAAAARGLTAESAQFGCLFDFLLRPTTAALAPLAPFVEMMRDPAYATVGVHVRSGDTTWGAESAQAASDASAMRSRGESLYASHAFIYEYADRLATQLAANVSAARHDAATPPLVVSPRLLLLGDSGALRAHVASLHADEKLIVPTGALGHVARQADALSNAVGEHWLFGLARAFVYSSHSGFPRTAAARALRDDAIHTCYHYSGKTLNPQPTARECTGPYSVAELGERHAAGL